MSEKGVLLTQAAEESMRQKMFETVYCLLVTGHKKLKLPAALRITSFVTACSVSPTAFPTRFRKTGDHPRSLHKCFFSLLFVPASSPKIFCPWMRIMGLQETF